MASGITIRSEDGFRMISTSKTMACGECHNKMEAWSRSPHCVVCQVQVCGDCAKKSSQPPQWGVGFRCTVCQSFDEKGSLLQRVLRGALPDPDSDNTAPPQGAKPRLETFWEDPPPQGAALKTECKVSEPNVLGLLDINDKFETPKPASAPVVDAVPKTDVVPEAVEAATEVPEVVEAPEQVTAKAAPETDEEAAKADKKAKNLLLLDATTFGRKVRKLGAAQRKALGASARKARSTADSDCDSVTSDGSADRAQSQLAWDQTTCVTGVEQQTFPEQFSLPRLELEDPIPLLKLLPEPLLCQIPENGPLQEVIERAHRAEARALQAEAEAREMRAVVENRERLDETVTRIQKNLDRQVQERDAHEGEQKEKAKERDVLIEKLTKQLGETTRELTEATKKVAEQEKRTKTVVVLSRDVEKPKPAPGAFTPWEKEVANLRKVGDVGKSVAREVTAPCGAETTTIGVKASGKSVGKGHAKLACGQCPAGGPCVCPVLRGRGRSPSPQRGRRNISPPKKLYASTGPTNYSFCNAYHSGKGCKGSGKGGFSQNRRLFREFAFKLDTCIHCRGNDGNDWQGSARHLSKHCPSTVAGTKEYETDVAKRAYRHRHWKANEGKNCSFCDAINPSHLESCPVCKKGYYECGIKNKVSSGFRRHGIKLNLVCYNGHPIGPPRYVNRRGKEFLLSSMAGCRHHQTMAQGTENHGGVMSDCHFGHSPEKAPDLMFIDVDGTHVKGSDFLEYRGRQNQKALRALAGYDMLGKLETLEDFLHIMHKINVDARKRGQLWECYGPKGDLRDISRAVLEQQVDNAMARLQHVPMPKPPPPPPRVPVINVHQQSPPWAPPRPVVTAPPAPPSVVIGASQGWPHVPKVTMENYPQALQLSVHSSAPPEAVVMGALQMSAQMQTAGIDELSNQLYACERELREQDREKQERERVKAEKREQLAVAQAAFNSLHDPYQAAEEKRREEMLQDTANRRARLERELELKREGKKHTAQVIESMTGQSHGPEATSRWRTPW